MVIGITCINCSILTHFNFGFIEGSIFTFGMVLVVGIFISLIENTETFILEKIILLMECIKNNEK